MNEGEVRQSQAIPTLRSAMIALSGNVAAISLHHASLQLLNASHLSYAMASVSDSQLDSQLQY